MFITIPHIRCDFKECKNIFTGDRGLATDEKSLADQAGNRSWIVVETNGYGLHFCGAHHASQFFVELSRAVRADEMAEQSGDHEVAGSDLFWNNFIGEMNARMRGPQ